MEWDVNLDPVAPLIRGDVVILRRGASFIAAVVVLIPSEQPYQAHYTGLVRSVDGVARSEFVQFQAQHVFSIAQAA